MYWLVQCLWPWPSCSPSCRGTGHRPSLLQVGVALVTSELSWSSKAWRSYCSKYFSEIEVQVSAYYFSSGSDEEDFLHSLEDAVLHPWLCSGSGVLFLPDTVFGTKENGTNYFVVETGSSNNYKHYLYNWVALGTRSGSFETRCHVARADCKLPKEPRMTLNFHS